MIRLATHSDLPRLFELVMLMYAASEYPGRDIGVSEPAAKALLRDCVARNGRTNDGGVLLNVVEKDGEVEGFMLALIQRIYLIGNRLEAQDAFLFVTDKASRGSGGRLFRAYLKWALANPKVADIAGSWTDVAGVDGEKMNRMFRRLGLRKRGEIWKRGDA